MPSLDGLRAIAILAAMLAHLNGTMSFPVIPPHLSAVYARITSLGVRAFFVLSGFLITTLLKDEAARTGDISLRWFYFRRTLRIFPACYAYLIVLAIARAAGLISMDGADFFAAATYTTNYHHDRSWWAGHTWSLAVEEQFYLLWPFAMKLLAPRRARALTIAVIVASPLVRVLLYRFAPAFRQGIGETFPTVADTLAAGCLLALSTDELGRSRRYLAFLSSPAFWLAPLAILVSAAIPSEGLRLLVGETVMNISLAMVIDRFVRFPETPVGRLLNTRVFVAVGSVSYSLYLWQQPFLNRHSTAAFTRFPLNVALAVVMALLSYHLVEQPMLRLRGRLERRWRERRARIDDVGTRVLPAK